MEQTSSRLRRWLVQPFCKQVDSTRILQLNRWGWNPKLFGFSELYTLHLKTDPIHWWCKLDLRAAHSTWHMIHTQWMFIVMYLSSDLESRKSASAGPASWYLAGNLGSLLERLWEGFGLNLIVQVSWGQGCFCHARIGVDQLNISPYFFSQVTEKIHSFLLSHMSISASLYFISGLFSLCIFLLITVRFPSVTIQGFVRPPLIISLINVSSWHLSPTVGKLHFYSVPLFPSFPWVYVIELLVIIYPFSMPRDPKCAISIIPLSPESFL